MSNEAWNFALKNALDEIKNVCPEISNTFIFKENGEIIALDQTTPEVKANNAQEAFRALNEKSSLIGGIESLTVNGKQAQVKITRYNDLYVGNVASSGADEKAVASLTHVMIPTMLRLVQQIYPSKPEAIPETPPTVNQQVEIILVPSKPELSQAQFTVENLGISRILNNPDVALIENSLITQWSQTYGHERIKLVTLTNPSTGKNVHCYFRPIKDSKYEGKGVVQLSEKLQNSIDVKKGAQVILKPVIDDIEATNPITKKAEPKVEKAGPLPQTNYYNNYGTFRPKAPINQCIVETLRGLGGFLGTPSFVRVDTAVIAQWKEMFEDKEIKDVIIQEIVSGKRVSCKFHPLKDPNLEGKGVVQLPEKIQQILNTKKGGLVIVKPVVD